MGSLFGSPPPEKIPVEIKPGRRRRRPPREPDPTSLLAWLMGTLAFLFAFGIALIV